MKRKMDEIMAEPKSKPDKTPEQPSPERPTGDPRPSPDPGPSRDGRRPGRADDPIAPPENPAKELGGRKGLEPTRYGDWEVRGIASDF